MKNRKRERGGYGDMEMGIVEREKQGRAIM